MKYVIELTESAQQDADAAYKWLSERTVHAADWLTGLFDAIGTLAELPSRCSLARENQEFKEPVRQLLYGKTPHVYRVLFIVRGNVVYVLHVRHRAKSPLPASEFRFP